MKVLLCVTIWDKKIGSPNRHISLEKTIEMPAAPCEGMEIWFDDDCSITVEEPPSWQNHKQRYEVFETFVALGKPADIDADMYAADFLRVGFVVPKDDVP